MLAAELITFKRSSVMLPSVYVDTNVRKFSAARLPRLRPRTETINWGDTSQEVDVYDLVDVNPNDAISNPELRREVELLPQVAALGTNSLINFVSQVETEIETWGLPNLDSRDGAFYGATITSIDAPVTYGRVVIGAGIGAKEEQFRFLASISAERFLELQRITGAYQGPGKLQRNQLLDAWHIWCAEHYGCDYFLTLDFKLQRVVARSRRAVNIRLTKPSELISVAIGSI